MLASERSLMHTAFSDGRRLCEHCAHELHDI